MARKKKSEEPNQTVSPATFERHVQHVHVDQLIASPLNPRKTRAADFEQKLRELADSIAQLGLIEAPMVREVRGETSEYGPRYEVLAGERRWRASKIAAERVPARAWLDVVVIDVPDDIAFRIAIAENDQRDDMHPLDQCDAFVRLREQEGASVAKIAALVGRTEQYIYDRLRLEQLTGEGRQALISGRVTLGVALVIARVPQPAAQDALLCDLLTRFEDDPVPLHYAQQAVKRRLMVLSDAPFDATDATLTRAGSCSACPKRSEVQQSLFGDLLDDRANRCLDLECWEAKVEETWLRARIAAADDDVDVATPSEAKKIYPMTYGPAFGYVDLDAPAGDPDAPERTWGDVVASQGGGVKITLVRDPSGKPHRVVRRAHLRDAREEDAVDAAAAEEARAKATAENRFRERLEVALRDAIVARLHAGDWNRSEFWRAFAIVILRWWGDDTLDPSGLARHGIVDATDAVGEGEGHVSLLVAKLASWSDAQRLALCVDLLVGGLRLMAIDEPGDDSTRAGPALLAALGVDRKLHEKSVKRAMKGAA